MLPIDRSPFASDYDFIFPRSVVEKFPNLINPTTLEQCHHPPHGAQLPHPAIDIRVPVGQPYEAIISGKVTYVYGTCGLGLKLTDLTDGVEYEYCHGSKRLVPNGKFVFNGAYIGLTGNTGSSTGPHLHFQISYRGALRCPQPLLEALYFLEIEKQLTSGIGDPAFVHPDPRDLPTSSCVASR